MDYAIQADMGRGLEKLFPKDHFVGEESAGKNDDHQVISRATHLLKGFIPQVKESQVSDWINSGNGEPKGRFWVIDPIDATGSLLRGGQYSINLAFGENHDIKVAMMVFPRLPDPLTQGLVFLAVKNCGTWCLRMDDFEHGNKLEVSRTYPLSRATPLQQIDQIYADFSNSDQRLVRRVAHFAGPTQPPKRCGAPERYAYLSAGLGDFFYKFALSQEYSLHNAIWDHAAGILLVREAGGHVTDLHGHPFNFNDGRLMKNTHGILASNGWLHDELLEVYQEATQQ